MSFTHYRNSFTINGSDDIGSITTSAPVGENAISAGFDAPDGDDHGVRLVAIEAFPQVGTDPNDTNFQRGGVKVKFYAPSSVDNMTVYVSMYTSPVA
jgi:hypothetical protein